MAETQEQSAVTENDESVEEIVEDTVETTKAEEVEATTEVEVKSTKEEELELKADEVDTAELAEKVLEKLEEVETEEEDQVKLKDMVLGQMKLIEDLQNKLEAFSKETEETKMSNDNKQSKGDDQLLDVLKSLQTEVASLKADTKKARQVARQEIEKAKLEVYKDDQISKNNIVFPDVITGSNKKEIDASIKVAKEKQATIANAAKEAATAELLTLHPSLARTLNPLTNLTDGEGLINTKTYKGSRELAKMSKNDFRKFQNEQKRLLLKKGLI